MRKEANMGVCVAGAIVLAAVVLPVLYVLSLGPALALCEGGYLSGHTLQNVYAPLDYVAQANEPACNMLAAYSDLWLPPPPTLFAPLPPPPFPPPPPLPPPPADWAPAD